ncbi:MAG: hypothetical protein IV100_31200, partial [Myxococcales bacterium]|nr:hypothetical protein [Myxococcales bacterium]
MDAYSSDVVGGSPIGPYWLLAGAAGATDAFACRRRRCRSTNAAAASAMSTNSVRPTPRPTPSATSGRGAPAGPIALTPELALLSAAALVLVEATEAELVVPVAIVLPTSLVCAALDIVGVVVATAAVGAVGAVVVVVVVVEPSSRVSVMPSSVHTPLKPEKI